MMTKLAWSGFVLAEAGMLWCAFAWPLAVGADPGSALLRWSSQSALSLFLLSLALLLALRVRRQGRG